MWRRAPVPRHRSTSAGATGSARPRASARWSAIALGSLQLIAGCLALLVALNRSFYALLVRRQGLHRAIVGVGLHTLHHLVAVAAVPVGVGERGRRRSPAAGRAPTRAGPVALERRASNDRRGHRSGWSAAGAWPRPATSLRSRASPARARRGGRSRPDAPCARRRARRRRQSALHSDRARRCSTPARPDAVVLATPVGDPRRRRRRGRPRPGCPALVEKPPAPDAAAASGSPRLTPPPWVGFNRRFDPGRAQRAGRRHRPTSELELELEIAYRRRSWRAGAGARRRAARPRAPPRRLGAAGSPAARSSDVRATELAPSAPSSPCARPAAGLASSRRPTDRATAS